ncbi:MAG: hypothetical protein Q9218_002866 [Villophora microphyllina]
MHTPADITMWKLRYSLKNYPIQKKFQTPEYLRTVPHLRLRLPVQALLARLRSESDFLLAQFFRNRGFLRLQPPIITSSDCEGAGEVFTVVSEASASATISDGERSAIREDAFFKKPKFLTVSSQLHLEAYMQEHPKVWTLSPTFRAEKSDTPRHVSEFQMLEVEMRTRSLGEVMDLVENMIKSLVRGLRKDSFLEDLIAAKRTWEQQGTQDTEENWQYLSSRWDSLESASWPRITYTTAVQILRDSVSSGESSFNHELDGDAGLHLEHEKYIAAKVGHGQPVFVTDYPQAIKPFYMLPSATRDNEADSLTNAACFDLLLPEVCEVVGGSLREHRLHQLEASMVKRQANLRPAHGGSGTSGDIIAKPAGYLGDNLEWMLFRGRDTMEDAIARSPPGHMAFLPSRPSMKPNELREARLQLGIRFQATQAESDLHFGMGTLAPSRKCKGTEGRQHNQRHSSRNRNLEVWQYLEMTRRPVISDILLASPQWKNPKVAGVGDDRLLEDRGAFNNIPQKRKF